MVPYSRFFFTSNEGCCCCCFTGNSRKKNRRTFFKIIDAAVVVAYTPLLINDRFCSRTSSLRCRQYCLSSDSLFPLLKQAAASIHEEQKLFAEKKEEKKENARRAFAHTKKRERDRQTRFIYSSNQPPGNTFT